MNKMLMPSRLVLYGGAGWQRLAIAWLVSAACLLLGALLALAVRLAHHSWGLLVLALALAGWLHAIELGLAQALVPTELEQPALPTRWLPGWYCGFCLTQGLGLAAGYLAWTATPQLTALAAALF